jgi:hypothetical protein
MLGFRGHYSTRSRCYSTTLTALPPARQEWRNHRLVAALGYLDDTRMQRHGKDGQTDSEDDAVLVIGQWHYRGRGH